MNIDEIDVRVLRGPDLEAALDGVAQLRITVFRDWPYLYDGSLEYEREYLATYRDNPGALLVGAFHDGQLIGASTSTPMEDHAPEFAAPFRDLGIPPEKHPLRGGIRPAPALPGHRPGPPLHRPARGACPGAGADPCRLLLGHPVGRPPSPARDLPEERQFLAGSGL